MEEWHFGALTQCCSARRYERTLEGLQRVPDLAILTVHKDGTTAGYRNPVCADAMSSERFAISIHNQAPLVEPPYAEYTIAVSMSYLQRAKQILVVLPTREQSDFWRDEVSRVDKHHAAERIERVPASALLSHPDLRIVSVDDSFTRQYIY